MFHTDPETAWSVRFLILFSRIIKFGHFGQRGEGGLKKVHARLQGGLIRVNQTMQFQSCKGEGGLLFTMNH